MQKSKENNWNFSIQRPVITQHKFSSRIFGTFEIHDPSQKAAAMHANHLPTMILQLC